MNAVAFAKQNYRKFAFVEGNAHIASQFALITILRLIDNFGIKSVLEVGLGIGSIADTVTQYAVQNQIKIKYVGTEANAYCLESLSKNVGHYAAIEWHREISEVPDSTQFDLIIIDGSDEQLAGIANFCHDKTIIYVEGYRETQLHEIQRIFKNCLHANVLSARKNPAYGPFPSDRFGGGGQLIFTNPDLRQKWQWFWEKSKSYIKRRYRKYL